MYTVITWWNATAFIIKKKTVWRLSHHSTLENNVEAINLKSGVESVVTIKGVANKYGNKQRNF